VRLQTAPSAWRFFCGCLCGLGWGTLKASGNVLGNWKNISNAQGGFWTKVGVGFSYFAVGTAAGYAIATGNVVLGGAIQGYGNAVIAIGTGNTPSDVNPLKYALTETAKGAALAYGAQQVGTAIGPYIEKGFRWVQSAYWSGRGYFTTFDGIRSFTFPSFVVSTEKEIFSRVGGLAVREAGKAAGRKLGDLTKSEISNIQNAVNSAGRPLEVVGSAAKGTRNGIGLDVPFQKGVKSDIDYIAHPNSIPYFEGIRLPDIDKGGIIPGLSNPYQGPAIRFEPFSEPLFQPFIPFGH
jgi:hypothetical protein